MNLQEYETTASVGRGRGRGRGGGTAILPEGIWNDIVVNRDEDEEDNEVGNNSRSDNQLKDLDDRVRDMEDHQRQQELLQDGEEGRNSSNYANAEDGNFTFMKEGFGGRNGVGRGRGKVKGQSSLGPGGVELNKKGVDWNCPTCGNLNWSWRTNCNKCDTGKVTSFSWLLRGVSYSMHSDQFLLIG